MLSDQRASSRIAIIDVGSNSVRLVVFDGLTRAPAPIFNEKVMCGLGRDPQGTGRLNPQGVEMAVAAMKRFASLVQRMQVSRVDVIATAAVRVAEDGPAFCRRVESETGLTVTVIDGLEEARLSSMGVVSGEPGASGIVGDIGGGSLELALIDGGMLKDRVSLPLGALRLATLFPGRVGKAAKEVDFHLSGVEWLQHGAGKPLYAVGGSWRAIAKIWTHQNNYPLSIVHNMTLPADEAIELSDLVAIQDQASLERVNSVSRRRVESLPFAAKVMSLVMRTIGSSSVVFSGNGIREGWMYEALPEQVRKRDPLIEACTEFAANEERFRLHADELFRWTEPMFTRDTHDLRRLRTAACIMGDVGWMEHPDYRAQQTYYRILRHPFLDVSHWERVYLAFAVACRYSSEFVGDAAVSKLLDEKAQLQARILGLTMRLGHTLSGGVEGTLPYTQIENQADKLILHFDAEANSFAGEVVEKRLGKLARLMGKSTEIKVAS